MLAVEGVASCTSSWSYAPHPLPFGLADVMLHSSCRGQELAVTLFGAAILCYPHVQALLWQDLPQDWQCVVRFFCVSYLWPL